MRSWLPRAVLWLSAATFAFFGLAYLIWPGRMAAVADLHPLSPTARADVRAVYGGLEIAVALILSARARRRERMAEGLAMAATLFAGLALGRLAGALAEAGPAPASTWRVIGGEAFGALGSAVAWALGRPPSSPAGGSR